MLLYSDFCRFFQIIVCCSPLCFVASCTVWQGKMYSLLAVITHSTKAVVDGDSEGQRFM